MALGPFQDVNAGCVLELYEKYRRHPEAVDADTRRIFDTWSPPDADTPVGIAADPAPVVTLIVGAADLVESIRPYGHLAAQLDPLGSAHDPRPLPIACRTGVFQRLLNRIRAALPAGSPALDECADSQSSHQF
jgi:2-oxoglutarate dehydrogenase E1 component